MRFNKSDTVITLLKDKMKSTRKHHSLWCLKTSHQLLKETQDAKFSSPVFSTIQLLLRTVSEPTITKFCKSTLCDVAEGFDNFMLAQLLIETRMSL